MLEQAIQRKLAIAIWVICLLTLTFIFGCSREDTSEKWIGHYMFNGKDINFPLHIDIQIQDGKVRGVAFDGSMEEATVTGSVKNGYYELLLHPVKHGEDANQDVFYRGKRSGDSIIGEWEHIVGVKGPWVSNVTDLGPSEAIEQYKIPCEDVKVSSREDCGNGS